MANTGKIAEVIFENAIETYEHQDSMLDLTMFTEPDPKKYQNSNNFLWKTVQQQRPTQEGWDMTGNETDIIRETYPLLLGLPQNDLVEQRADDLRDTQHWIDAGIQSGFKQASVLNTTIANVIRTQGSKFYRSNDTSGYEFISEGQAMLNETQQWKSPGGRAFILNDRTTRKFAIDLAARQTLQGRPEQTWVNGQIGQNIAGFNDVMTGSFLPSLVGGADPATTVTADVSGKPEAGSVDAATGVVTNIDYRSLTIPVTASASYNVGDKVTFANGGTDVESIGRDDKNTSGEAMTFTIVAIPDGTSVQIYPKPIALDDPALDILEASYANINTQILDTATMNRLNIDASAKTNLFFDKSAIEVVGGTIPAELLSQFAGMKVVNHTMKNGLNMYMVYDANMLTMNLSFRLFTWYGVTMCNPQNAGVAVSF